MARHTYKNSSFIHKSPLPVAYSHAKIPTKIPWNSIANSPKNISTVCEELGPGISSIYSYIRRQFLKIIR